jgi:hypothetical protein
MLPISKCKLFVNVALAMFVVLGLEIDQLNVERLEIDRLNVENPKIDRTLND